MISLLAAWSVRNRVSVVIALALLGALALWKAQDLPLDALPDLTNNQVIVLTSAPGLAPEEVELLVTRPLELALAGVAGVVEQRSLSRYGISAVTIVFEDDKDPWLARQMVAERLQTVNLVDGVGAPELAPMTGGLGEIFHATLSSGERTPAELLEIADLRIAPILKSVGGIVEVNTWGGAKRTYDAVANPAGLAARNLTLSDLRTTLAATTVTAAGGSLEDQDMQVLLRAQTRPRGLRDLQNAVVALPNTRVSDVANVTEGHLLRLGAATENGRGETVYVMAQMLRNENALDVMRRVHAKLPAILAALPKDVKLTPIYDRSVLVNRTLLTVGKNLLEGFALVSLVLLAFLGSWRAGLIVASVIPLSMALATAVMALLDLPGNLMSLGALDFGLLVDGAVVMAEGVFHHAHERGNASWSEHVRDTAQRAARPVFFSVLVIVLVYVPVLAMTGTDGKLFRPMALTVVIALSFSLVLALTWVPALCALWLKPEHVPTRPPWIVRLVDRLYPRLLAPLLSRRLLVVGAALVLLGLGAVVFRTLGVEFTPQLDEGDVVIQTTREPEIRIETSVARALHLESVLLRNIPEVTRVTSRIGSPAVATDIMGLEQADVLVALKPRSEWRASLTRDALIDQMQHVLETKAPGGDPDFTQPIQMRFNELLGGAVTDVAISIYGDDLDELNRLGAEVAAAIDGVAGAKGTRVLAPPTVPIMTARPLPLEAAQLGLRVSDVMEAVQALRVGVGVGETYDGAVRVPVRMRLEGSAVASQLPRVMLPIPSGSVVPLERVAEIVSGRAPGLVNRRNGQRRIVVGFNVRGADLATVVQAAQAQCDRLVKLPAGYRAEWGGQYESLTEAAERLAWIVPIVLVLILALLMITFGHVRPALSVFSVVPIAAVGGVIALASRALPISLPAAIGFIALSGIAVMNGVVWMARALELEETGLTPAEVARTAALQRVRPVLMTALVAAFGFIPMMLSTGDGAEVQRPLATVVVGGLITSTWLTLIVLPVLYPWLRPRRLGAKP